MNAFSKYADLAGSWYPGDKDVLEKELSDYLDSAEIPKIKGDIIGVIAPHAGLKYSGPIAAYSYKAVMQKDPALVILIAFSHRKFYPGKVAALEDLHFITPLGKVYLDNELTKKLISSKNNIESIPDVFLKENSVETQIPFIQTVAKNAKLLVLVICDQRRKNCDELSEVLYQTLKDRDDYILIASSDMCHFLSSEHAKIKDANTIKVIEKLDSETFYIASMKEKRPDNLMCGYGATYTLMHLSEKLGANDVQILKYGHSGETSGNNDRVVGYMSAVFTKSTQLIKTKLNNRSSKEEGGKDMLNQEQRKELLDIARSTIKYYLETGKKLDVEVTDPLLKEDMGSFVTLHKNGQLRGCIGHMVATGPLYLTIRDMAISASVHDPRFPKLEINELENIDLEISVLSPMKQIKDYNEILIPGQGVMVRKGFRSGVYLPQVADETGWDREQFMNSLCANKAGLPMDAWKTGDCDLYTFTAEVFGEIENDEGRR